MQAALGVVDSLISDGPVTSLRVSESSQEQVNTMKPNTFELAVGLINESSRIKRSLQSRFITLKEQIIPLLIGGWRIEWRDSQWLIDYGLGRLFNVTGRFFQLEHPLTLSQISADEQPTNFLYINDEPAFIIPESNNELERSLFYRLCNLISQDIFKRLWSSVLSDVSLKVIQHNISSFTAWRSNGELKVTFSLKDVPTNEKGNNVSSFTRELFDNYFEDSTDLLVSILPR